MMTFEEAENKGRIRFAELCNQNNFISNLSFTTYKYDPLDGLFDFAGRTFGVEIKYRESTYNVWNIEYSKLVKAENDFDKRINDGCYYIVFITKDKYYMYDYETIKDCIKTYGLVYKEFPKSTLDPSRGKEIKELIQLPIECAKIYEYGRN